MKVIFSDGTADLSAIQSVCVSEAGGKVKILGHHQTKRTEKVSSINFRRKIHYSPDREITREFAEKIAKDLEDLMKNPDTPIEQVIERKIWAIGYLQVDLNTASNDQATIALARLCCDWLFGRSNTPSDDQLTLRTGLDTSDITRIAASNNYKKHVEELLFNDRTGEEFKTWVESSPDLPARLGRRMRFSESDARTILESIARRHRIAHIRIT